VFTGLITDVGTVERAPASDEGARLRIRTALAPEIEPGGSVAVNGACLTAAVADREAFEADVSNHTLRATALGALEAGSQVNLELPLRLGERLGGHLVQGHVDAVGEVVEVEEDGFARRVRIQVPAELHRYLVERGSATVDGVSLTVASLTPEGFEVSLVPETLERTTLGDAAAGRAVNVEVDMIARHVERLVSGFSAEEASDR
jgi:riboflavin synthase